MNKNSIHNPYPVEVDLSNCDTEPIHIIPYVQHHACLIACNQTTLEIIHASENLKDKIGIAHLDIIGKSLETILEPTVFTIITDALKKEEVLAINPVRIGFEVDDKYLSYNLIVHTYQQRLILEFEPYDPIVATTNYQYSLGKAILNIQQAKELHEVYKIAAREISLLTGYDRVMVYKFDQEGHGQVIAEEKSAKLDSFLGLNYPATDIPKQARALFLINKVRLKSNVNSTPSAIYPLLGPDNQAPLDLTHSVNRGVSPIHLEYLRNMGVNATMSIAIENNGKLWGMFACHHYSPKFVNFELRKTCEFIGQIFSGHLSLHAANEYRSSILEVSLTKSRLFEQMSTNWNVIQGLINQKTTILDLFKCKGACILSEGNLVTIGTTPSEDQIRSLAKWLNEHNKTAFFQTNELSRVFPAMANVKDIASGLLSIRIMPELNNYIMWFRAELVQEVFWAGNPKEKDIQRDNDMRLSPRKSFEKWKESVNGQSSPWSQHEIESVLSLRNDIKDFIYKKYREVKNYNEELTKAYDELESFSYSVSHDLRAPLRNINGFAQILLEDYSAQLDEYGKDVVNTIVNSTTHMNSLINDILTFSKIGRSNLIINELKIENYASSIFNELILIDQHKNSTLPKLILKEPLPLVYADAILFKQLMQNLLSNAIKYSSMADAPQIEVGGHTKDNVVHFYVKDNGMGFNLKYKSQIFKVFTRLINSDKYTGNGVGLAIVKRIIEQHNGSIDVDSTEGEGTTFFVSLPISNNQDK